MMSDLRAGDASPWAPTRRLTQQPSSRACERSGETACGADINAHRGSNLDAHTKWHAGFRESQVIRKRIAEANNWVECVAGIGQSRHYRLAPVGWMF